MAAAFGLIQSFPEIDRVEWFDLDEAARRLKSAQVPFLERLRAALAQDREVAGRRDTPSPP